MVRRNLHFLFLLLSIAPSLAWPAPSDLEGLVINVRVSRSGPKDMMNAPREALQRDFSSRFRGEGAELIFAGSEAGSGRDSLVLEAQWLGFIEFHVSKNPLSRRNRPCFWPHRRNNYTRLDRRNQLTNIEKHSPGHVSSNLTH